MPVPHPPAVHSVTLNYPAPVLARGQALQLFPTPRDASGGSVSDRVLTWSSTHPEIAAVDLSGTKGDVRAVAPGVTTITGSIDGVTASSTVTVIAFGAALAGPENSCAISLAGALYCAGVGYGNMSVPVAPALRFSAVSAYG